MTQYLHLPPGAALPEVGWPRPYKAVVLVEADVDADWQSVVSAWLIRTGCLFMMAWGTNCETWDDSVDHACLERYDYGDVPEEELVLTTWHPEESLADVLFFAKHAARHGARDLSHVVLLHIAPMAKEAEVLDAYARA